MKAMSSQSVEALREEDPVEGFGMTIGAMQSAARRQLVGSVVVAVLVVAAATLVALRPTHSDVYASARQFHGAQQPIFAAPAAHLAAVKHEIELP